ncbi:guanosine monophosphate reductase [Candidatus Woesearchaeota archaeon]|nr:guanosine monophosphate reductase [Candidatus Woesearchaeota archaeon]
MRQEFNVVLEHTHKYHHSIVHQWLYAHEWYLWWINSSTQKIKNSSFFVSFCMENINHKALDKTVFDILSKDFERQGFVWSIDGNRWILTPEAQMQARARGGYTMGQLVHRAREYMHMTLAPDDVTGVPFTGSASRRDCDVGVVIAKNIKLPTPIFSANMESVTNANFATTLAKMGGVGVLHQFQDIASQVAEINSVKNALVKKIVIDGRTYEPAVDGAGRFLVAAASGVKNNYMERVDAVVGAGADILVLDIAHGDSRQMHDAISRVRDKYPDIVLMAGNIITPKAAYLYCKNGVNIIKANVGPGFACTTRKETGFGVPSISGLYDVVTVAREFGVSVVGDGGVNDSGDAVKYFAAGVNGVMIGSMFGATSDSALFESRYNKNAGKVKVWGSASSRAKESQGRPRWDAAEGVVRELDYLGETSVFIARIITGIQSGLSYAGTSDDGKNNLERLARYSRWTLQTVAGAFEGKKGL